MCFREFSEEESKKIFSILKKMNKEHKLPKSSSVNFSEKHMGGRDCERCILNVYGKRFKTKGTTCLHIINYLKHNEIIIPWYDCLDVRTLNYKLLKYFESNLKRNIKI